MRPRGPSISGTDLPALWLLPWVAVLILVSTVARAQTNPSEPSITLRVAWAHGGRRHTLRPRWDPETGTLVLRAESESTDRAFTSYEERLQSVVGPMISVRTTHDSMLEDSVHASRSDRLEVRFRSSYRFDLESYLRSSKQSGEVVWQWLAQLPPRAVNRQQCPTEDEMRWADRSLGFWVATIRESGCVDDPHGLEHHGSAPKHFAIHAWDPTTMLVTLRIEASTARIQSTAHELTTFLAQIRPPPAWIPWLDAARSGNGLLESHIVGRVAKIHGPEHREAVHRLRTGPQPAQRLLIGRLVEGLRLHRAGVDDDLFGQACFEEVEGLRGDSLTAEFPGAACIWLDVVTPESLSAAGLGPTTSTAQLKKAFARFTRPGELFLVAPTGPIERAYPAEAIPISRKTTTRLVRVLGE